MNLVWGSLNDSPVERVLDALAARSAVTFHIDDNALEKLRYDILLESPPSGWIELEDRRIPVQEIRSAYIRPAEPKSTKARIAAMALLSFVSSMPGVVINRPTAGRSNASKPYQLNLIASSGFEVPDTLVTTDPVAARAFLRKHSRLVYKSLSGIRSIVATLDATDEARLEDVRNGPVQLQEYVVGLDVRVHIIGDRWFACSVQSEAIDYRYGGRTGMSAELSEFALPEAVGTKLVALARQMNLLVAGIDLRYTPEGSWVCFEVNPSPGFPWYEDATGDPIAEAIAELLDS